MGLCSLPPKDYGQGQEIYTICVAFITDVEAGETKRLVGVFNEKKVGDTVHICRILGQDKKQYIIVVNFADSEVDVDIAGASDSMLLTPEAVRIKTKRNKDIHVRLIPRSCILLAQ